MRQARQRARLIPAHAGKTLVNAEARRRPGAHPRSRGENPEASPSPPSDPGSSPLTRGKQPAKKLSRTARGLIPAHAGKTAGTACAGRHGRAHPRSRGENLLPARDRGRIHGSSPLTRGKHRRGYRRASRGRLIPAHAGKTSGCPSTRSEYRAHPRSRGENAGSRSTPGELGGSSPLTRGKHCPAVGSPGARRLIPAHAGKTRAGYSLRHTSRAHPRSRGENVRVGDGYGRSSGSSPLTRGKQRDQGQAERRGGLIPAHAGKTRQKALASCIKKAHPRSRGENCRIGRVETKSAGSSPLTRGKHLRPIEEALSDGLIPAHAGKTPSHRNHRTGIRAHPRSRGENGLPATPGLPLTGSSPLTRGKQVLGGASGDVLGLIPAHAGKTPSVSSSTGAAGAHPRSRGENVGPLDGRRPHPGSSPLTRGKPGAHVPRGDE